MPRIVHNKLIRDKIPEIIHASNAVPVFHALSDDPFRTALKEKLLEESLELKRAETEDDVLNELADVAEVLETIIANHNLTQAQVNERKEKKRLARGGFEQKLFLEYVDEPEGESV